jgi:hypothetical protein
VYHGWYSRFYQPDPWEGSYDLTDPQSFNRYAYVQNDPVNFTDPSGLDAVGRLIDQPHWTEICFSAAYSGCGFGPEMAAFAEDFSLRQTFGYNYWDLPGYANEAEQGEYRYLSIVATGFDPAFGIFRGTVQVVTTQGNQTEARTLRNPTYQQIVDAYLQAFGLDQHMKDQHWISGKRKNSGGYSFYLLESGVRLLEQLKAAGEFKEGRFGVLHEKEIGKPWRDFRSLSGARGLEMSLQITFNTKTLRAWADVDEYNPYQGLRGFLGHTWEVFRNALLNIFGGGR